MSALLFFTIFQVKQKEWDSVFEDWNPKTPEKYPFTSSTEGDFYITHCVFEDKSSCAITISTTNPSRIVLETSYFSNIQAITADACALSATNAGCVITKCCISSSADGASTIASSFTSVHASTSTQPLIYRENSVFNCGYFSLLEQYSGTCNYIEKGEVTIETFNITQSSSYRGSAFYFSGVPTTKATISQCEFIDNICYSTQSVSSDQCSVFVLGNNREFSLTQNNIIRCDSNYLFYVKAKVTIDGCSILKGTKDSFLNLYTVGYASSVTISSSYVDYTTDSSATINDPITTEFTIALPTFNMNACFGIPPQTSKTCDLSLLSKISKYYGTNYIRLY